MILPKIIGIGLYNSQVVTKNVITTPNRTVKNFEIELPIDNGGIAYVNNENRKITKKLIICAKPGQIRCTKLPYKSYYIHLDSNDSILYDTLSTIPNFAEILSFEYYYDLFNQIFKSYTYDNENKDIIIYSNILKLIYSLSKNFKTLDLSKGINSTNYQIVKKIISFIEENITDDLSLSTLSNLSGYSMVHLHNSFKKYTGKTPQVYIEDLKINKAIEMMLTSDKTLTEISYTCGFSSQSYFSYVFKRKFGLSPREYIKNIINHYPLS